MTGRQQYSAISDEGNVAIETPDMDILAERGAAISGAKDYNNGKIIASGAIMCRIDAETVS